MKTYFTGLCKGWFRVTNTCKGYVLHREIMFKETFKTDKVNKPGIVLLKESTFIISFYLNVYFYLQRQYQDTDILLGCSS
jgi:hypothetical protein